VTRGYTSPLYLLPFDHRHSYVTGMFQFTTPLTADEHNIVAESKRLIYDGFLQALGEGVPSARGGILVDEEFGESILRDAIERGYVTALSTEKSGSDEFDFEYGTRFAEHIESFGPTFAKVLVRYNPEGDAAPNRRQTARLAQLSDYCRTAEQRFMFELLVPATTARLADRGPRRRCPGRVSSLRCGFDECREGVGVRHRYGIHVRVLGLGRRALFHGLGDFRRNPPGSRRP
jgi:myo-inositol catabolism protein IolC